VTLLGRARPFESAAVVEVGFVMNRVTKYP
jgi:hypothetical protein